MKNYWIGLVVAALVFYIYLQRRHKPVTEVATPVHEAAMPAVEKKSAPIATVPPAQKAMLPPPVPRKVAPQITKTKEKVPDATSYTMDEGLIVIQGDLVVGVPVDDNAEEKGYVKIPTVSRWASNVIPYYIQPNVKNPERVMEALQLFNETTIRFVPYTNQEDVLVFEDANGICKSYVGRIGGKQPLWIPPRCGPSEIAHEIMHALGFVHEQNRADRDNFIEVHGDNIKDEFKDNFDKLPAETTRMSSLEVFDFESIMMYPPDMFAKTSNQPTMTSKIQGQEIRPGEALSAKDKSRIDKAYP
jgi:hypothetical protein